MWRKMIFEPLIEDDDDNDEGVDRLESCASESAASMGTTMGDDPKKFTEIFLDN